MECRAASRGQWQAVTRLLSSKERRNARMKTTRNCRRSLTFPSRLVIIHKSSSVVRWKEGTTRKNITRGSSCASGPRKSLVSGRSQPARWATIRIHLDGPDASGRGPRSPLRSKKPAGQLCYGGNGLRPPLNRAAMVFRWCTIDFEIG